MNNQEESRAKIKNAVTKLAKIAIEEPSQKNINILYEAVKKVAFKAYNKLHVFTIEGGKKDIGCYEGLAYIALIDSLKKWNPKKGSFSYYYHIRAFYLAQCHIRSSNFAIALPTSYRKNKHGEIQGIATNLTDNPHADKQVSTHAETTDIYDNLRIDTQAMSEEHLQFYNEMYVNLLNKKEYIKKYKIAHSEYTILKDSFEAYVRETYSSIYDKQ